MHYMPNFFLLVSPAFHLNASSITVASEPFKIANCHHRLHRGQRTCPADVPTLYFFDYLILHKPGNTMNQNLLFPGNLWDGLIQWKVDHKITETLYLSNFQVWSPVPMLEIEAALVPLTDSSEDASVHVSVSSLYLEIVTIFMWSGAPWERGGIKGSFDII